jgi:hypothetical protein
MHGGDMHRSSATGLFAYATQVSWFALASVSDGLKSCEIPVLVFSA